MYTWGYLKETALAKLDITINDNSQADDEPTQELVSRFPAYANEVITQVCSAIKPKYTYQHFTITDDMIGIPQTMPDDFVSFGDDVSYLQYTDEDSNIVRQELFDTDYAYHGYNQVIFNYAGEFYISYNARWYTFSKSTEGSTVLNIPTDILDCIPSYIASQCYKIDDEYKASVYRNEYEMLLARIDNTHYKNTKTMIIKGDW